MHLGVGIIIRNESGDLFFIQEKDETYPIEKYRNCYSLFGGKIEEGETPLIGLRRELKEEIEMGDLIQHINIHFLQSFIIKNDNPFSFHLFEGIMNDDHFNSLLQKKVIEGRSKVLNKNQLENGRWIWGLEKTIAYYLVHDKI